MFKAGKEPEPVAYEPQVRYGAGEPLAVKVNETIGAKVEEEQLPEEEVKAEEKAEEVLPEEVVKEASEVDLNSLKKVAELKDFAKDNDIEIPSDIKNANQIRKFLKETLNK